MRPIHAGAFVDTLGDVGPGHAELAEETGGGSPAYAVTPNANGSVTVSVTKLAGVAGANARLQVFGLEVALVPVEPGCPALSSLPKANWPPEARTGETARTADGAVTDLEITARNSRGACSASKTPLAQQIIGRA